MPRRFSKFRALTMGSLFLSASFYAIADTGCSVTGNFNGTPIGGGDYIWFNAVVSVQGLGSNPVTVSFTNSTIQFSVSGVPQSVNAPNAQLTFSPSITTAATVFNAGTGTWTTMLPISGLAGNDFLTAVAVQVPAGGWPGGIKPLTWAGTFSANAPGITAQWQWAAAVYTHFSGNYNSLGVKPVDDNKASPSSPATCSLRI